MIVLAVELGVRPDRVPLRIGYLGKVPAYRAEVHELDAGASEPSYPVAHVVLADARGRIERTRNGLSDRRRVTVAFERFECRDAPVLDPHTVGAPMRRRQLRRRVRLVQNRVSGFHAGCTPLLPVLFGSRMIFY